LLSERHLCGPRQRVVVAVSGGPDSVCLLHVLSRIHRTGRRLVVGHVDHRFRPDSHEDAEFVEQLARRFGLPYLMVRVDGPGYARAHGFGLEQAGRALRYQALAAVAREHGAGLVATGHTLDDSVESVLMHFVRGAGPEGLAGIAAREALDLRGLGPVALDTGGPSVVVIRPLLAMRRAETAACCARHDLPWRTDPTNADTRLARNRVRHHLLPVLRTYNPAVDLAVARTANVVRDEQVWLDAIVGRIWSRAVRSGDDGVELRTDLLRRQPRAAQRRLLRRAAAAAGGGGENLGFEAIERALVFAAADRPARLQLPNRLVLIRAGEWLELRREGAR
jgi:tRNA(Ile)-lysidine synthase